MWAKLTPSHSNLSAKRGFLSAYVAEKFLIAPCLRCWAENTEVTHKIDATQAQLSLKHCHESPHCSEGTFFGVTELYWDWPKGNSPGIVRNQKLHQASIQATSSLSTEPDEAGTIWGLATEVLWVYVHAFNSREGQWYIAQFHPLRMGDTPAFCSLAHIMVEDSIMREGVPPAWQTSTKAAEPIRESQHRKGAGVSCIASERRTDLSPQGVESGQWKPSVIQMAQGSR